MKLIEKPYNAEFNHWVEQRLVSKYDKTHDIADLFEDIVVEVNPVNFCPKCGRELR